MTIYIYIYIYVHADFENDVAVRVDVRIHVHGHVGGHVDSRDGVHIDGDVVADAEVEVEFVLDNRYMFVLGRLRFRC